MKCYYHPGTDSSNACSVCRRPLCPSCSHTIKGRIFCQDCLVSGAELAALAASPQLANYSPARAALFGIIPGLGAVYNSQYTKAVLHFAIFAGLVIVGEETDFAIFVLGAISFYIFMIVDAYRSAQAILRGRVREPEDVEGDREETNLPLWGGILILMGLIFFLSNLGIFSLTQIVGLSWPLIFVAGGLYLVLDYYLRDKKGPPEPRVETERPRTEPEEENL